MTARTRARVMAMAKEVTMLQGTAAVMWMY